MMTKRCLWLSALVIALVVVAPAMSAHAGYYYGFVWDRSADYDPGTTHGSSAGNPNTDAQGATVWSMESTNSAGTGLGGANPWYTVATQLQVWDDSWYGGGPTWARGDNSNPPIGSTSLTHNISNSSVHSNIPLIRWLNPLDETGILQITGTLTENWRGASNACGNIDFDVAIVHYDASALTYDVLYGELFEKPHDDTRLESLSDSIALSVLVEPGDQIIVSHRGRATSGNSWPNLSDDLTLRLVPEPTSLALLGLGALGLFRRRRR